ncbi:MAG TPA: tRNA (N(6)-L-threonylcarbamoyladenosine(37)-C(2))-methylthiotransferase MtaB [Spirochaetota bacterium]|nr:tRNA (N(6)-L-threonylcarbamoyladenosine(37)-C(2))-methylthiotransferase MtaB [Spirochaetota bacterium]HOM38313.1 tRNA (N(6)-L-threonylcarbamoyladenosine(37)-C(2))-methylthiotransferase MtaB [Spirochaetota bacterium]HPQ48469.1 tRNA (N(6)-L-threonylcarbamoyladenosine(37)-C(2))-methylthiotransferase MtaB [Spirochaetota bacterium]
MVKSKVGVVSLGCRLNSYEIDSVVTSLKEKGYEIDNKNADIYIVNSCVITERSEAKTRNFVNRFLKRGAKVIIAGCMAKDMSFQGNVFYVPNDFKYKIPEIIEDFNKINNVDILKKSRFDYKPPYFTSNTRVNVKIQDGCNNYCSYCILPYIRGDKPLSRPVRDIENEIKTLIEKGFKEIVITGLNIAKYNFKGYNLTTLIEHILNIDADFRIHFSSIDPNFIDNDFINLFKSPKMVKHLHLSLQHCSDRILKLMNRNYNFKKVLELVSLIRSQDPLFNFTADIISGFPSETEDDHNKNVKGIQDIELYHSHIFRYSDRPGTAASKMSNKVKEQIKKRRINELNIVAYETKNNILKKFSNKISRVLIEEIKNNFSYGLSEYYIPVFINRELNLNRFYKVKTFLNNGLLIGEIINDNSK